MVYLVFFNFKINFKFMFIKNYIIILTWKIEIDINCFLTGYQALAKFRTEISTDFVDNPPCCWVRLLIILDY